MLSLILRVCIFGTYFGHGCLAIRFVPGWLSYLRVVAIGEQWARLFMPIIGISDVIVAFLCLLLDCCPLIYCWAFVWGLSTALIRPIAGESIFGCIERTGNFLPSLALLWLCSGEHFGYYLLVSTAMICILGLSGYIFRLTGIFNK